MARISSSKGREARLNKAIFWILSKQGPLSIYDIWQKVRIEKDFAYIRYHVVNRRIRVLEKLGYIEKDGERRTKTGFIIHLYQLTVRTYLAILVDKIDLASFIEEAPETYILTAIAALTPQRGEDESY